MKCSIYSLLISSILFSTTASFAQSGVRFQAGLNLANVSVTDNGRINKANELTSFQVGFVADVHVASMLYFQPGLLYTGKGSKVQSGDPSSANYYKATANPFYIDL